MLSAEQLFKYHRFKDHRPNTRSRIRGALRHWERLGLDVDDPDSFAKYRDARLAEGARPDTVKGEMNKLLGIARWLGHSPLVKLPRAVQRMPEAWDRHELRRLFHTARTTKRTIWGLPGRVYWPALLGVAYDTGERIGAIMQLQLSDFDLPRRSVSYRAEIRKGGYADAVGQLCRRSTADIEALVAITRPMHSDSLFLLGSPSTLWKAYGRILADAGLPCGPRCKFHRLRRTHATMVHAAGGDATASLGHSNPQTTWRHYIDPTKLVRKLPWRGWGM